MFCKKCGNELANNQKFCNRCGTAVTLRCRACGAENAVGTSVCTSCGQRMAAPTPQPPRRPKPAVRGARPNPPRVPRPQPPKPQKPVDPATALVNGRFRSILLLACILLLAGALVLSIYGATGSLDALWDEAEPFVSQLDKDIAEQIDDLIRDYDIAMLASAIVSNLPSILMLVGLCICFAAALVHPQDPIPTAGLSIIRVLALVLEILYIVLGVALLLGSLAALILTNTQFTTQETILLGAVLVASTVAFALTALYYAKGRQTAQRIRGYVHHDFSAVLPTYVPIMSYIVCGVEIVFAVALWLLLDGFVTALPMLLNAAYLFCLGVYISNFRQSVSEFNAPTGSEQ